MSCLVVANATIRSRPGRRFVQRQFDFEPAAIARATHPISMSTPPIGVIMPSFFMPVAIRRIVNGWSC